MLRHRRLGRVDTNRSQSSCSTAAGEGLAVCTTGRPAEFVLTAAEFGTGKQRAFGGDHIEVWLQGGAGGPDSAHRGGGGAGGNAQSGKRKRARDNDGGNGHAPKKGKMTGGGGGGGGGAAAAAASSLPAWAAAAVSGGPAQTKTRADAADSDIHGDVVDQHTGQYNCSYTLPTVHGSQIEKRRLHVVLNGEPIAGSPFAVDVLPSPVGWRFESIPKTGGYDVLPADGNGAAVKRTRTETWQGAVAGFGA